MSFAFVFFFGGRQAIERASRKRERREAESRDEESETVFALILWGHFPPRLSSALVLHHARMTALQSSPSSEGKGDKEKERAQGGAREENRKQRKASMSPRRRHSFFLFDHDPERLLSLFSFLSLLSHQPPSPRASSVPTAPPPPPPPPLNSSWTVLAISL